jgi:putative component of membrane protein insertase Oxa1/YidC/SpoIIIJ protein YidD
VVSDSARRLSYWISAFLGANLFRTCKGRDQPVRYGVLRGRKLAICRLMKCYPFHPEGMELVK